MRDGCSEVGQAVHVELPGLATGRHAGRFFARMVSLMYGQDTRLSEDFHTAATHAALGPSFRLPVAQLRLRGESN
jgi:hypothetical protein